MYTLSDPLPSSLDASPYRARAPRDPQPGVPARWLSRRPLPKGEGKLAPPKTTGHSLSGDLQSLSD